MCFFCGSNHNKHQSGSRAVLVQPKPEPEILFPKAEVPISENGAERIHSYENIARSLGFKPAELVRIQLLEFFKKKGMKLYNYQEIKKWLTEKKKRDGAKRWCWRPLRKKDEPGYDWGDWSDDGSYDKEICPPYEQLVPMHALEKVVEIEKEFGSQVKFFVSDYPCENPDPFIMVRPAARNDSSKNNEEYMFVFDVWDEPGFGKTTDK